MNCSTVVNLGIQRFDRLREQGAFYIDKTDFIKEWWETGSDVTMIMRPRRFGKTLNMSMLECFFSYEYAGRGDLFEGLSIWKEEKYRELQGTFPVIFLSFANIKADNYEDMEYKLTEIIADLYNKNDYLLEGNFLNENEKEYYLSIKPGIKSKVAAGSIRSMSNFMKRYYKKDVIIILDEYDTPMQEAWLSGYWEEAAGFFRGLLNSTFKTNPSLHRGMITGITRISKESIFSDLNNLKVVTTTSEKYEEAFGFTEREVFKALDETGFGDEKHGVKEWYDGFTFGKHTDIYNPWSIAAFIENGGEYENYWTDTSANGLVNSLVKRGSSMIKIKMEDLIAGKPITANINEQIVFNQLNGSSDAVWSLLLATGYLKVSKLEYVGVHKKKIYTLSLTNMEVENMFEYMVKGWFGGNVENVYNNFINAFLNNDLDAMNEFMNKIALRSFSSFDMAGGVSDDDAPERFYHGFVLGLMVELSDRYKIISNRESGFGRYDVMLVPKEKNNDDPCIIEFKVHKPLKEKNLEETVENALLQIEEKRYSEQLIFDGFLPETIRMYGFAFKGKECLIGQRR